ncbi:hypothetical protein EUTSA_v10003212mg [Eutrema salsugineum]|uniref:Uncharacterized protein n=1 Tax=Eutrema salsugineum TaxID=72664 RepID=V4L2N0_EUTSA|nr:protein POLLENLESS 3-LIKE 1 [Eutrema salsugineum]ESQ44560.1 hypothetical protein EUTSA_v10003212mg [Eutrema salsugineum]
MWRREDRRAPGGGFWTPPPTWNMKKRVYTAMPISERKRTSSSTEKQEPFHMIHKVPSGDSPYVRAKHAQLICKDPDRAISLFWAAINAGDRVDSALKDMAVVMKQLDRADEGIEAIKSFRYLCTFESQDSIDNLLLELYKKSGRIQEEAELLEHKLRSFEQDERYGGRITIAKRCHGKQINMTIEQEKARILGNLAWVHLQLHNYGIAEQHYRDALCLEPDNNKQCNLAICLMRMDRIQEAKSLLEDVRKSLGDSWEDEPFYKSFERANEMIAEREQATLADKSEMRSSSSDNFSPSTSFASWMKEKQTGPEPGNKKDSHDSHVSIGSVNSPVLITQPRECKLGDDDEEEDHWKGQVTIGAARRLRFGNTFEVKHCDNKNVESTESANNALCITIKARKMCADLLKEKQDSEKGYQTNASGSSSAYAQIMDISQRTA